MWQYPWGYWQWKALHRDITIKFNRELIISIHLMHLLYQECKLKRKVFLRPKVGWQRTRWVHEWAWDTREFSFFQKGNCLHIFYFYHELRHQKDPCLGLHQVFWIIHQVQFYVLPKKIKIRSLECCTMLLYFSEPLIELFSDFSCFFLPLSNFGSLSSFLLVMMFWRVAKRFLSSSSSNSCLIRLVSY